MKRLFAALSIALCGLSATAAECSLTLNATDAGWYHESGFHDPANLNFFAGYNASGDAELRNFFVFDIPAFSGPVAAATLRVFTFDIQAAPSITLELHHISTSVPTLVAGGSGLTNIFTDLGDGPAFATRNFLTGEANSTATITLNSNLFTAVLPGQRFAISGRVTSIPSDASSDHSLFGFSYLAISNVQLSLTLGSTAAPFFIRQLPTSLFATSGFNVTLSAEACGPSPISYRWFFNGTPISSGTSPTLSFNPTPGQAGDYFLLASNSFGPTTSSVLRLYVDPQAPTVGDIIYEPDVNIGEPISLSVNVSGVPPPTLQWQFNDVNIPGATNSSYAIAGAGFSDGGIYTVIASNALGVDSRSAAVTVAPLTVSVPTNKSWDSGTDNYLVANVNSVLPATFQWRRNGTNIPGANFSFLPFLNFSLADTGSYDLIAANVFGARTSAIAFVSLNQRAPELSELSSLSRPAGAPAILSVTVRGSEPLDLQWYFNNVLVSGATNTSLAFEQLWNTHTGSYYVVGVNAFGITTSAVVTLNIQTNFAVPSLTFNPESDSFVGDARLVRMLASGNPLPAVQWQLRGTNIPGATNETLFLPQATLDDRGPYRFVATNVAGTNSVNFTINIQPRRAADRWAWRNRYPQANDLEHIAFGNGVYVTGGEGGTLMTSSNLQHWKLTTLGSQFAIKGIAFGNGTFLALVHDEFANSIVFTSSNGSAWIPRGVPRLPRISTIAFFDGRFHAFAPSSETPLRRAASIDGVSWTNALIGGFAPFSAPQGAASGNGIQIAISFSRLYSSDDGAHFKPRDIPALSLERVTFANGQFVAVGAGGQIWISTDGEHWLPRLSGTTLELSGVTYGNGRFVIAGEDGTLLISTDNGATWNAADPHTGKNLKDIIFDGTRFVVCGNDGLLLSSTDGTAWTDHRNGITEDLYGIVYTNGLFATVGHEGVILISSNGVDWITRNSTTSRDLHAVAYASGQFVAVGRRGTVLTSPNGINWTSRGTPTTNYLQRIAYGNGLYVAVGSGGTIVTSSNAIDWAVRFIAVPPTTELEGIAFGSGKFVIVGGYFSNEAHSIVAFSDNGANWTVGNVNAGKILRAVVFADNKFIAVGNDGANLQSLDGVNWIDLNFIFPGHNLRHAAHIAGRVITIGNEGTIFSTRTFPDWDRHRSIVSENLHGVAYGQGKLIAVGNAGTIVQCDDVLPVLSSPTFESGMLRLTARDGIESTYRIQFSTNLFSWINTTVFTNNDDPVSLSLNTNGIKGFYRAVNP